MNFFDQWPDPALQRAAPGVTAPAFAAAFPPAMQAPRRTPRSLSLRRWRIRTRTVNRTFLIVAAVNVFLFGSVCSATEPALIDAQTAMRLAEEFVRANGYTDAPATKSISELDGESFERTPREQWPDARGGLLNANAYGYQRGARSDTEGWRVLFRIKGKPKFKVSKDEIGYGKPVEMDRYGQQLLVLHGAVTSLPNTTTFPGYTKRADTKNGNQR